MNNYNQQYYIAIEILVMFRESTHPHRYGGSSCPARK